MNDVIIKKLKAAFRGIKISAAKTQLRVITAIPDNAGDILRSLKDEGYNHLALISCVDWIDKQKLELVYVLSSYFENDHIILKTNIPRKKPLFRTMINIYENAEPYEREIHELFGITFEGHPRQIPLFLEREYEIPPFRKDFDTRKYVKDFFDPIPSVEENK
ncbi:NADH-quinone oxidoreductase subunit C [candidate division WOR-3 bacterium]|nr:NADH-quinone oxidoreductase subunit C [candidate division WOR-3 bacterium]